MYDLRQLFLLNRQVLTEDSYKLLLSIETPWVSHLLTRQTDEKNRVDTASKFQKAFESRIQSEAAAPNKSAKWVAEKATLDGFRVLVQEFAVDGLTEAQSFFPILPRLPYSAQMPMMRILIDEFGCGNWARAHSSLYTALLDEIDMSSEYSDYLGYINNESYAFLNIFYWLTERAPNPGYFLGALTYLEASIPTFFQCYVDCCQRLHIENHAYYSEHIHIDFYHAREGQRAISEAVKHRAADFRSVWAGVQLASSVTSEAFEAAVAKARRGAAIVWGKAETRARAS